jgi:hypothetical protein
VADSPGVTSAGTVAVELRGALMTDAAVLTGVGVAAVQHLTRVKHYFPLAAVLLWTQST